MRHAADTEGNTPYLLFSANTEAPSRRILAANKYLLGGYSASGISGDKTKLSKGGNDFWGVFLNDVAAPATSNAEIAKKFKVFPNPARDKLNITCGGKFTFTLKDQSGKTFAMQTIEGKRTIDISHVPSGIYFLSASNGEKQLVVVVK